VSETFLNLPCAFLYTLRRNTNNTVSRTTSSSTEHKQHRFPDDGQTHRRRRNTNNTVSRTNTSSSTEHKQHRFPDDGVLYVILHVCKPRYFAGLFVLSLKIIFLVIEYFFVLDFSLVFHICSFSAHCLSNGLFFVLCCVWYYPYAKRNASGGFRI